MLRISDRSTPTCFVVEIEGPVSGDELEDFSEKFEDAAEQHGSVNLVVSFLGKVKYADKDAFEEDWDFTVDEYKKARRAAFVGGKGLAHFTTKVVSPFTKTEEMFFEAGQLDQAIEWACAEE